EYFQMRKACARRAERWLYGPSVEIARDRIGHNATIRFGAGLGAGSNQHVPSRISRTAEHPWVAPRFFWPARGAQCFVEVRVSDANRARMLGPTEQIGRCSQTDRFDIGIAVFRQETRAGVIHAP